MANLFGALDLAEIPEVLPDGTYPFILKNVREYYSERSGNHFLVFDFVVNSEEDPDILFPNFQTSKWFQIYPDLTQEELDSLDPTEKKRVINNINNLRKWLRSLNVLEEELGEFDYTELTGLRGHGYGTAREKRDGSGKEWTLWTFVPE